MKISVLGAGAMGSLFGGLLAERGHQVELLDVNPVHLAQVRAHGLVLDTEGAGRRTVRVAIARPEDAALGPDCLLVFTKTLHTTQALQAARAILSDGPLVLTLQNGLGNVEKLAQFVPLSRIAVGVTTVPADLLAPGQVQSHGQGGVRMMRADGAEDGTLVALADALTAAGLPAAIDLRVREAIWQKVAFNAALNSVCAVADCSVGSVGASPGARALAHRIAGEVLAVAAAAGVRAEPAEVARSLDHAMDTHLAHKPSMLQDMQAGRPTEIDAINGEVLRVAGGLGVQAPCTEALDALVRLREALARPAARAA